MRAEEHVRREEVVGRTAGSTRREESAPPAEGPGQRRQPDTGPVRRAMDRPGLLLGFVAGLAGISCCVGPAVLALLGLSSVSFAISLGNTLYYRYGWYFRGAAVVFAAVGILGLFRRRKSCTLRGVREQWRLLVTVASAMVVVYAGLYWLTTWLALAAS